VGALIAALFRRWAFKKRGWEHDEDGEDAGYDL
jgi:hypothetical protein